jgi:hypothetical protein
VEIAATSPCGKQRYKEACQQLVAIPEVNIVFFAPNVARRWWYCATAQNNVS